MARDPDETTAEVTRLLRAAREGSSQAWEDLLPLLYGELRGLAQGQLRRERSDHTLQPTALVHEAYLKLLGSGSPGFEDRHHFLRACASAMRQVLVDHARARKRLKRGGDRARTSLDIVLEEVEARSGDLLSLDEALRELSAVDAEKARLVELRFFAGSSMAEAAQVLGLSLRTAERHWALARAWLRSALDPDDPPT